MSEREAKCLLRTVNDLIRNRAARSIHNLLDEQQWSWLLWSTGLLEIED